MYRIALAEYDLEVVGADHDQAKEIASRVKDGLDANADLCALDSPICHGNKGLARDKMPQVEGEKLVSELLTSEKEADRDKGRAIVDAGGDPRSGTTIMEDVLAHLNQRGIHIAPYKMQVGLLRATQKEIKADKAYGMADNHLRGEFPNIDDSIVVSQDGYILDGHHRWAALLLIDPSRMIQVHVVHLAMDELLSVIQQVPGVYREGFDGTPVSLKRQLVRLAYMKEHLRPWLLPILTA